MVIHRTNYEYGKDFYKEYILEILIYYGILITIIGIIIYCVSKFIKFYMSN